MWLTIVVIRIILTERMYELFAFSDLRHATTSGGNGPAWTLLVLDRDLVDELAQIFRLTVRLG